MTTQQPGFSMSQYASSKDLFAAMIARITELEPQLAQRFDAADMATAAAQGFRDGVASLSANAGEPRNAIDRDALIDAIAQGLHGTWHCTRAWEAWHVGTMSQDDFEPVDESEMPTEIADAVLALLAAPPAQPAAQQGAADGFFLLLPQRPKPEAPAGTVGLDWGAYSGAQMLAFGRECSDAAIAALRTEQPAPSGAGHEQALEEALRERDEADDFIDTLLDEVLGADRAEWSSAYGRADALEDVLERITALHKPAVDRAWTQFEAATKQGEKQ